MEVSPADRKVVKTSSIRFPSDSVIPTCLGIRSSETVVGFSNGQLFRDKSDTFETPLRGCSGIGAIDFARDDLMIAGNWRGHITQTEDQPHIASIRSIVSSGGSRVAIASTDGRVSIWYV